MENEKINDSSPLLMWLFIAAGTTFIFLSFWIRTSAPESLWFDLLLNIGATFVSTAVIAFIYQKLGKNASIIYLQELLKNFSIIRKSAEIGLVDIWGERRQIHSEMWNRFTAAARTHVWLLGIAEFGYAEDESFHKIVALGAAQGCEYRFLILDPDSKAASFVDEREGGGQQVQGRIRRAIKGFKNLQKINSGKRGSVELRLYSDILQASIVRSDNHLLVTPYIPPLPGNSSFTFRIQDAPNGVFDKYVEHFEAIWSFAKPISSQDKED